MRLLNSRLKLLMLTMIISLLSVVSAKAEWSNDPNINLAICTATGNQDYPKLISDGNGGVIIVWFDNRNGNYDIYAQKIDYSGKLLWPSQGVCICSAPDDQEWVEMISDGVGGAIVVWQDSRNGYSDKDIYAQRIDDSGNIIWPSDGVPICSAESHQEIPKLISDEVGGAIIVWEDYRNMNSDIYAQRVDQYGSKLWMNNGVSVCTAEYHQDELVLATDGLGGAIIAWTDSRNRYYPSGTHDDIYAQRIDALGNALWNVDGIPVCSEANIQKAPQLVEVENGGAIIVWEDCRYASFLTDIYCQRINGQGNISWWPNSGVLICATSHSQENPVIASNGAGGAFIAWDDDRNGYDNTDIYVQQVDRNGLVEWGSLGLLICNATNVQGWPNIFSDGDGGVIIVWEDDRNERYSEDIYAQRLDASGNVRWLVNGLPISTAAVSQIEPELTINSLGQVIITWNDYRNGSSWDVYAQHINMDGDLLAYSCTLAEIISYNRGRGTDAYDAWQSIGLPDGFGTPLGDGGILVLRFVSDILDQPGPDIRVYELGHSKPPSIDENYLVEASYDGTPGSWTILGEAPGDVVEFDLADGGLGAARFVRITDLPPVEQNQIPNADYTVVGADIDAVVALNCSHTERDCTDGYDNDGDGDIDCADSDCWKDSDQDGWPAQPCGDDCDDQDDDVNPGMSEICNDYKDNDCNGLTDCEDVGCISPSYCPYDCTHPNAICGWFEPVIGAPKDPKNRFDIVLFSDGSIPADELTSDAIALYNKFMDLVSISDEAKNNITFWRCLNAPPDSKEIKYGYEKIKLDAFVMRKPSGEWCATTGDPPYAVIPGDLSTYQEDVIINALHELGHAAFYLADEYSCEGGGSTKCNRRVYSMGDIRMAFPNVFSTEPECDGMRTFLINNYGVSVSSCDEFCSTNIFRIGNNNDNNNLMRAYCECKTYADLNGNGDGQVGNIRAEYLILNPLLVHSIQYAYDSSNIIFAPAEEEEIHRTLRLFLRLGPSYCVADSIIIEEGAPVNPGFAMAPIFIQLLDQENSVVSQRAVWDPRYETISDSLPRTEEIQDNYIIAHGPTAQRWRLLEYDGTILGQGSLGSAFLDYSYRINFTDADCWLEDADHDTIPNVFDNCPNFFNPHQVDTDGDGIGDECESAASVFLVNFTAERENEKAVIKWQLLYNPIDHIGFDVYREEEGQVKEKISKKPVTGQLEYEFVDNSAPYESAKYWLYELSSSGRDSWHGPAFLSPYLQRIVFALFTVYPNPFNAHTEIKYSVPQPSFVQLTIFDSQGKMVRRLVNKQTKAGINTTSWDGTNENGARVSSGVYFLRLNAGKKVLTRKMIMLK